MLDVTFEFVGGPNDGQVVRGSPGEQSDAHRYYLFSHHGRIGQSFKVASEHAIEALTSGEAKEDLLERFQQHYYVVTERLEDNGEVWVRAEYAPELAAASANRRVPDSSPAPQPTEPAEPPAVLDPTGFCPHLLIASPRSGGTSLTEAVVLLLDRDDQGAHGLVLNCPVPLTVSQVWEKLGQPSCDSQQKVNLGGLEDGPVLAMHTDPGLADLELLPGVFLAVSPRHLDAVVRQAENPFRLFIGLAQWPPGELDEQLADGDWLVLPASGDLVFAGQEDQDLWKRAVTEYARGFFRSWGVRHLPDDVSWN